MSNLVDETCGLVRGIIKLDGHVREQELYLEFGALENSVPEIGDW